MDRRKFTKNISSAFLLVAGGSVLPLKAFPSNQNIKLRFAVTSDGHYGQPQTDYEGFHHTITKAINDFHDKNTLDFCVVNGDIIHDNPDVLDAAAKSLKTIRPPLFVTKGNHDMVSAEKWETVWSMPVNHAVVLKEQVILLGTTSNEKGEYLCPDLEWFTQKLEEYKDAENIFIFIHITPVRWTTHSKDCVPFQKLIRKNKNIRAVFNGHDHDEDGINQLAHIPFLFDGHFGGNWGTSYRGFRVVEMLQDNSLFTYMMDPFIKAETIKIPGYSISNQK